MIRITAMGTREHIVEFTLNENLLVRENIAENTILKTPMNIKPGEAVLRLKAERRFSVRN